MNKKCSKCGEVKDISLFGNNKLTKDKKQHSCKTCYNSYKIQWKKNNPEKMKSYYELKGKYTYRDWADRNKLHLKERNKKWQLNNQDKVKEYERKRVEKYKEKGISRHSEWRVNNPEKAVYWDSKSYIKRYKKITNPPPELIQQKVEIRKIKRLIKQIENGKD